jgi:HK97 family phage prohead protease
MTDIAPEIRTYPLELRDAEVTGRGPFTYLEGRAVPYNTWQDVGPIWENHAAGSFERSTKGGSGRNLPLVAGHDAEDLDNLLGHAERWKHDATGMYGLWKLNDQPKAQQAAALVRSGDLTGLSVGFQEMHYEVVPRPKDRVNATSRKPWVLRTESRLLHVGITSMPAFPDAGVIGVRSLGADHYVEPPVATPDLDGWRAKTAGLAGRWSNIAR